MALARELREVGGQLIYDRPWHCALCRKSYRKHGGRRVLVEFWDWQGKWRKEIVRLCVRDEANGCFEMGLGQLFFRAKGTIRRLASRRKDPAVR